MHQKPYTAVPLERRGTLFSLTVQQAFKSRNQVDANLSGSNLCAMQDAITKVLRTGS